MSLAARTCSATRKFRRHNRKPARFWSESLPPASTISISIIVQGFTGAAIMAVRSRMFPALRRPALSST